MNWYKQSKKEISIDKLNKTLKSLIKKDTYIINLFKEFGIPLDLIDKKLHFSIKDLDGKHAEANDEEIYLNKKLFENGLFFQDNLHFVIHELIHWLHRQAEKKWYFNDQEEIQSFVAAIAWELHAKTPMDKIEEKIYPIIKGHFNRERNAKAFFNYLLKKALLAVKKLG